MKKLKVEFLKKYDCSERDLQIMQCLSFFTQTTEAIKLCGYKESDAMVSECHKLLSRNFPVLELWLLEKAHEDMIRVMETETVTEFKNAVKWFMSDYYMAYSWSDFEKGMWNTNDSLFSMVKKWVKQITQREVEAIEWYNDVLSQARDELEEAVINAPQSTKDGEVEQLPTENVKGRMGEKYGENVGDMESFFELLRNMKKNKEVAAYHRKHLEKKGITLKDFVEDFLNIVPERKGKRGWNYEAIKKY